MAKGEPIHQAPYHCLVVAARAEILADQLGMSSEVKEKLVLAAAIHDAFKARQVAMVDPSGGSFESFEEAEKAEEKAMRAEGVPIDVIAMAQGAGHPVRKVDKLLAKKKLSESELAFLIVFYIDSYTQGTSWASSGDAIDARFSRDPSRYPAFDETARGRVSVQSEESGFEALKRAGHQVQERLAHELGVDPADLPQWIDMLIQRRIERTSLPPQDS